MLNRQIKFCKEHSSHLWIHFDKVVLLKIILGDNNVF